jgi:AraC family transcriptional regulator
MKNYGVCFENEGKDSFRYIACTEVEDFENIPENMVMADVEGSKYAVFMHKGKMDGLGQTYWKIMEFLKEKGMKQKPWWVEFYDKRWKGDIPESEFEIWVAIE